MSATRILVDSLVFPEDPRWHDGRLWFSDVHAGKVMTTDVDGRTTTVVEVPARPSGLGWLPNGDLLIVSIDKRLLRFSQGRLELFSDLSQLASPYCNDIVVDAQGRAYVGNVGFDLTAKPRVPKTGALILVTPDGQARVVARDLAFPNGTVVTPDAHTLIVGESFAARLTAFDIESDGSLTNRRVWAQFDAMGFAWAQGRISPDGICLDAEGAIWVTSPSTNEVIRVYAGGEITQRITASQRPFACMLGGPQRRTLFICTARTHVPAKTIEHRSGHRGERLRKLPLRRGGRSGARSLPERDSTLRHHPQICDVDTIRTIRDRRLSGGQPSSSAIPGRTVDDLGCPGNNLDRCQIRCRGAAPQQAPTTQRPSVPTCSASGCVP